MEVTIKETEEERKLVQDNLRILSRMMSERRVYEPVWHDITDYLYPRRGAWEFNDDHQDSFGDLIFDGEAIAAHNKLADGIFGELCSPSIDWLDFVPTRRADWENIKFMRYLRELKEELYNNFEVSNYYDALAEDIHDCSALGTSVINTEYSEELERPVYTPLHLREVYISENRFGIVDTLYRVFEMTKRQLVDQFDKRLTIEYKKECAKDPEGSVMILNAQYPRNIAINPDDVDKPRTKGSKPFASVFILLNNSKPNGVESASGGRLLENGGTDWEHFDAWRFSRSSGGVYGNSPAMDAIYDIKMINLQAKTMADAAQLAARPPVQAPQSMQGRLKIYPEGISYRVGDEKVEPIITSISYPLGIDSMERRAKIIREHFKTDFFMAVSQLQGTSRQRTATEIMELKAESAAILGSVVGRVQSERISPIVMKTLRILREHDALPEAPEEIGDIGFKLRYTGPLAQAQRKYLRVQGISQGLSSSLQYVQVDPDIVYNFKMNDAAREIALAQGFPYEFLNSKRETEQMIADVQKQRAQAQAAENQRLNMQAASSAAVAPQPGSPLEKMMKSEEGGE